MSFELHNSETDMQPADPHKRYLQLRSRRNFMIKCSFTMGGITS